MNLQSDIDTSDEYADGWVETSDEGSEPYEDITVPQFADGLAYRLDAFPWVAEDDQNAFEPLKQKQVVGAKQNRVTFRWEVSACPPYGLPRSTERALIAVLMQLSAEKGFQHPNVLVSFADVARRLGIKPGKEATSRIELGLARLAAVRVTVRIEALPQDITTFFGFEFGSCYPFLRDDVDRWARFEWDEKVFAVLAMSQKAKITTPWQGGPQATGQDMRL